MNVASSCSCSSYCNLPAFPSINRPAFPPLSSLRIKNHSSLSFQSQPLVVHPRRRRFRRLATRCSISYPRNLGGSRDSSFLKQLLSFLPGGNWWNLEQIGEEEEEKLRNAGAQVGEGKTSLSVAAALGRMWVLVSRDRWIVFVAFASLACASVMFDLLRVISL